MYQAKHYLRAPALFLVPSPRRRRRRAARPRHRAFPLKAAACMSAGGSSPASRPVLGSNVYRADSASAPGRKLNAAADHGLDQFRRRDGRRARCRVLSREGRGPRGRDRRQRRRRGRRAGRHRRHAPDQAAGHVKIQKVAVRRPGWRRPVRLPGQASDFNTDPYVLGVGYWKPSPEPYKLEAYRHDGTFKCGVRHGPAIEDRDVVSPVVVFDGRCDANPRSTARRGRRT